MGGITRRYTCTQCKRRYRSKAPDKCSCGSRDFQVGSWTITVRVHGRQVSETIRGPYSLAKRVLAKREAEAAEGKYRLRPLKRILFKDFIRGDYWNLYAKHLRSARDYWNRINQAILEFGDFWLHEIEQRDVEQWLAMMKARGNKSATIQKQQSFLQGVFSRAIEWKLIEENPVANIKPPKVSNERNRYLTKKEYQKLIEAAGTEQLKAAIALAVGTGLRKSNLFGLKWEHIDFKAGYITIPGNLAKGGKTIRVPMIDIVRETLLELKKIRGLHADYVIIQPRTGDRYKSMRTAFETALRRSGIKDFHWHDFRHTFASWLITSGADPFAVMKFLGHSSMAMMERYAHLSPDYSQAQIKKLESCFEEPQEQQAKGG